MSAARPRLVPPDAARCASGETSGPASHWQQVYLSKRTDAVSWNRPHLERSLELIRASGVDRDARILDVGGGAATLVDDLLAAGFTAVSVLDVSAEALAIARRRLGDDAARVHWIEGDITRIELPPASVDIWHDRAALHFLIEADRRRDYVRQLRHALAPGGHAILSTFAPDGPRRCSDLLVQCYDAQALQELLGDRFILRCAGVDLHRTPSGNTQPFTWCWFFDPPSRSPVAGRR
jgi:SAM-dependent methyltransferase